MLSQEPKTKKHKIELTMNEQTYQHIINMTEKRFGEINHKKISQLITLILRQHIIEHLDPLKVFYDPSGRFRTKRYELKVRLSKEEFAVLSLIGKQENTTAQGALFGIVRETVAQEKKKNSEWKSLIEELPPTNRLNTKNNTKKYYEFVKKFLCEE